MTRSASRRSGRRPAPLAIALFIEIAAFTFFYHGVFSDRAAFLHVGALIGTIMAASVFFVIIPNQKIVVADLHAGRKPDPRARQAGGAALAAQQLSDAAGHLHDDLQPLSDRCSGIRGAR